MADWIIPVATALGGGGLALVGNWIVAARRSGDARHAVETQGDVTLEMHRDTLTFKLLETVHVELSGLKEEVEKLRPLSLQVHHLEEALQHLEAWLAVTADPEARAAVERRTVNFLNRMRRGAEARGTIANEIQRVDSTIELTNREVARRKGLTP